MVRNLFLRFRADIPLSNPLSAGFFYQDENQEEAWIQFKIKRLSNYCYKCSLLDHVTGRCNFKTLTHISTNNGVHAKLYGPWLRIENNASIAFINLLETTRTNQKTTLGFEQRPMDEAYPFGESHCRSAQKGGLDSPAMETGECELSQTIVDTKALFDSEKVIKVHSNEERDQFRSMLAMSPLLSTLYLTLKKEVTGREITLQEAVIKQIKQEVGIEDLNPWFKDILNSFMFHMVVDRARVQNIQNIELFGEDFLTWLGVRPGQVI